jgi:hypothetical protein
MPSRREEGGKMAFIRMRDRMGGEADGTQISRGRMFRRESGGEAMFLLEEAVAVGIEAADEVVGGCTEICHVTSNWV